MKSEGSRKKRLRSRRTPWRPARPNMRAGDWVRLFAMAALVVALGWVSTHWQDAEGAADATSPVVIRSVMTSNPSACFPVDDRYYDWIELENTSEDMVSLEGWRLSDSLDQRSAFTFEDIALPGYGSLIVYCAPKPDGYEGSELFCGFRLSANGELLVLSDENQRLVQVLNVPALAASDVYRRDAEGNYAAVSFQQLAEDGAVDLRPPYDPNGVTISELMASNRTQLADSDGDYSDWIELYNAGVKPVNLTGCALSDDDSNQRKWTFPERTLMPGEYLLVFASGKDRRGSGELHANFRLSASGESVRLYSPRGEVLSWVEYDALEADRSLSRQPDGALTTDLRPTPGHENTEEGARAALSVARDNALGVVVNEVMCSGDGNDWIELYNAGSERLDLAGMGLSDNSSRPRKWLFPEGAILPAGGYLVVWLTGKDGTSGIENGRFCANFALSTGESICLSTQEGTLLDRVTLFESYRDVSYGRAGGHEVYRYFAQPTPGEKNADASYAGKASDISFSVPGGQHAEKQLTVAMSSSPGASIYYTTDGTEPTSKSKVYRDPIPLKKNAVIKAIAVGKDIIPSGLCVQSYLLGVSHTVRIVSVSGKKSNLNGSSGMLNTGVKGTGSEAYVEVYETDGTRVVAQKCLMKLAGHNSRIYEAQKGFSLRAKKAMGNSRFEYPLFSNRDYTWYKSFVMRASGQDSKRTLMLDSVLCALAAETSVLYRETEVSVLYVNGEYWGVYNMRERISNEMAAQFHGWENPDDVQIYNGHAASSADFQDMLRWVKSHDMSLDTNVEQLRTRMDIENYLEYVALEIYVDNQDLGNVAVYRNPKADNLWRWALFDLDLSYRLSGDNVKDWLNGDTAGSITPQDNLLFKELTKNAGLKDFFLRTMGRLLATSCSSKSVVERIRRRSEVLLPEMKAECKRWDWTVDSWKGHVKKIVKYAQERPAKLIEYLADDFHLSEAQKQDYFGDALALIQ